MKISDMKPKHLLVDRARLAHAFIAFALAVTALAQIGFLVFGGTLPTILSITGIVCLLMSFIHHSYLRETDQSEKLNDLKEQNRLLRMTEEASLVGHWRLDFEDNDLYWSEQTYQIYGIARSQKPTLEEAIDAFHPEDRPHVSAAVNTARKSGQPYSFSARLIQPNGEIRHTEAQARVELDASGKPSAIFGIFADRTDEVLLRDSLIKARNEALVAASAKSKFLAKMSHEIRTPMNGIIGFADLLLEAKLDPQSRKMVEMISESGNALTQLLNDILDLSKIEASELTVCHEPMDLGHLADQVVSMFQPQARERGLQLSVNIADDVPSNLLGDKLRVRQILSNLIGNALKFTVKGYVHVSISIKEGRVACRVSDSGPGIPQHDLRQIFEPFFQCEDTAPRQSRGTGLGLAISDQLAALMNGTIKVESTVGRGSAFEFFMPLSLAPVCAQQRRPTDGRALQPNQRVLLAEDYDINQILIAEMAEKAGIQLDIADNGSAAIEMIEEARKQGRPYKLILMDIQMPLLDGITATRRLRADGFSNEILPIVALSANAFPENVEECIAAGMQGHLAKPITFRQFRDELARWLIVDA